jgi:hypothetical protein
MVFCGFLKSYLDPHEDVDMCSAADRDDETLVIHRVVGVREELQRFRIVLQL